ncbi:hypothetical protein [Actinoplanes couchii]|uniref:Uncharacterized protein n=1 Tax=Actinoplanes couchii TaxID=403638 RepID=A0ABQ3XG53_9ACTN|nr:hypothetical protein [Actinoplanes couchii]MDR6320940.1 hypothetical protein [Actinoplanes couchii]GID57452.1 hypothetical protein Aco03nite_058560 [Actinoplanes couchii]
MAITADLEKVLDKAYQDKSLEEILDAPVEALAGVSTAGGKLIRDALGIKTIGELGRNKYFIAAQALAALKDAK